MNSQCRDLADDVRPLHISAVNSPSAVLLLHGITGSPASMRPLAREIAARTGAAVDVPLLAGHGTHWRDLARTTWHDWVADAHSAYNRLAADHASVTVAGLSMGGALAVELGASAVPQPHALVLINPALYVDSPLASLLPVLGRVIPSIPAIGNDIAMPGADERAYPRTPLRAMASFHSSLPQLRDRLWHIECPVTVCLSANDGVVGPRSARVLRSRLPRPPRIVALRRSRHVATLDYDADLIATEVTAAVDA